MTPYETIKDALEECVSWGDLPREKRLGCSLALVELEAAKERMPEGLGEALLGISGKSTQSDRIKERKAANVAKEMFGGDHEK